MIPIDLQYLFPRAIYLLLFTLVFLFLFWKLYQYRQHQLNQFQASVTLPRSNSAYWIKVGLLSLSWTLAILALMQPIGNAHYPEALLPDQRSVSLKRKLHDVILLVDASASMKVKDTRTGNSRFGYAKEIGDEIVERLRGETASLYAFTSATTALSPPTHDYLFVRLMMNQMEINEGEVAGTDLAAALKTIRERYFTASPSRLTTLIMISDGGDPGSENEDEIVRLLRHAERQQVRVYTVGTGSVEGGVIPGQSQDVISKLNQGILQKISRVGRGKFYFANDSSALQIADDLQKQIALEDPFLQDIPLITSLTDQDLIYDDYFQYPLAGAILLLTLALFLPEVWKR